MTRRRLSMLVLASLLLTAGCLGSLRSTPAGGEGEFHAVVVSEAPPNATVIAYADERVEQNRYLRRAVREAANDSEAVVTVPEEDVEETKADVTQIPVYTPDESNSSEYRWGYYVRYEGTVANVQFVVLD